MPFKSKFIPGDPPPTNESGEMLLLDDLAQLADQLCADAKMLDESYPASPFQGTPVAMARPTMNASTGSTSTSRRGSLVFTAVASGILLVCVAWMALRFFPVGISEGDHLAAGTDSLPQSSSERAVTEPNRSTNADVVRTTAAKPIEAALEIPVDFVQELSGPEIEGWLDLREAESAESLRVSI